MKILLINIVLITIITVIFTPAALAATLSLSPATGTFNKGCTLSLNVILDSGSDQIEGTDVNYLIYDTTRFTATSIQTGTIFSDYPINNIDGTAGKIYISGVNTSNKPFKGKDTFATVNFTVKDAAPTGVSQMTFLFTATDQGNTTDSNVMVISNNEVLDVLSSVINGSYTVGSGSCTAQSSSAPSPSPGSALTQGNLAQGGATSSGSLTGGTSGTKGSLPPAGSEGLTAVLGITGIILTVLGILGLVLL